MPQIDTVVSVLLMIIIFEKGDLNFGKPAQDKKVTQVHEGCSRPDFEKKSDVRSYRMRLMIRLTHEVGREHNFENKT